MLVFQGSEGFGYLHWLFRTALQQFADHSEFVLDISLSLNILDS